MGTIIKKSLQIDLKIGVIILLVIGLIATIGYYNLSDNYSEENELLKIILRADKSWGEVSIDGQKADNYYNEASFSYENGDYSLVESNCRLARNHYLEESQGYKRIKAELIESGIKDELIDVYINTLDKSIEITNNMFEACEHFESASRYYGKYYLETVWDDRDFQMGGAEIDEMNEKIKAHDKAVEEYNQYLEDFRIKLDKRIE